MGTIKYDLIIFTGALGSGKTTISELLQKELDSPLIDFGNLRIFPLEPPNLAELHTHNGAQRSTVLTDLSNFHENGFSVFSGLQLFDKVFVYF